MNKKYVINMYVINAFSYDRVNQDSQDQPDEKDHQDHQDKWVNEDEMVVNRSL